MGSIGLERGLLWRKELYSLCASLVVQKAHAGWVNVLSVMNGTH